LNVFSLMDLFTSVTSMETGDTSNN